MAKVKVDFSKCTGCYTCVDICPMNVYSKGNNKTIVSNEKDCIGCKACEVQCPVQCIEIKDD